MTQILKKTLVKASGNRFIQRILEKIVLASQDLMGIGSGGGVLSSGESVILSVLKQNFAAPYCIFDIGSNKGQFLQLIIDKSQKDNCSIHCFEPAKETFKLLLARFQNTNHIKLNNIGIEFSNLEKVDIDSMDNYCSKNAINHIHLLKN